MEESNSKAYFSGIPTEPDVNKLVDKYPVDQLTPGYPMPYSEVSETIGEPVRSSRWRSVTEAWRKKIEKDYSIIIECNPYKQQFCVLTEGGKVNLSGKKLRSAVTSARRSLTILTTVEVKRLTEDERKNYEFNTLKSGSVVAAGQLRSGRAILPEMKAK